MNYCTAYSAVDPYYFSPSSGLDSEHARSSQQHPQPPPRSRSGCWYGLKKYLYAKFVPNNHSPRTCRARKIKVRCIQDICQLLLKNCFQCDENKPQCHVSVLNLVQNRHIVLTSKEEMHQQEHLLRLQSSLRMASDVNVKIEPIPRNITRRLPGLGE